MCSITWEIVRVVAIWIVAIAVTIGVQVDRLLTTDMSRKIMAAILGHPSVKPLLSDEHFSVDGTLVKALTLDNGAVSDI